MAFAVAVKDKPGFIENANKAQRSVAEAMEEGGRVKAIVADVADVFSMEKRTGTANASDTDAAIRIPVRVMDLVTYIK
jgi:anti-sigma regulatory factor (Ser/Thr protein kinase)